MLKYEAKFTKYTEAEIVHEVQLGHFNVNIDIDTRYRIAEGGCIDYPAMCKGGCRM